MRKLILLLSVVLFTLSASSANGTLKWSINDTVIVHTDPQFTSVFRILIWNTGSTTATITVNQAGDTKAFKVVVGYSLGVPYPIEPNDSMWFDVKFTADIGKTSFASVFTATTTTDTAHLLLSSLYTPIPDADWDPTELTFIAPNCQTPARLQGFLINYGTVDVDVDSIRIVGDPTNSFYIESTSPQDRLRDFTIGPGGGSVTYEIIFSPVAGSIDQRRAKVIAYLATGAQDTMSMLGIVAIARPKVEHPVISLGLKPLDEDIQYYSSIDNSSGSGNFAISAVEILGEMNVTLEGLAADTVVEAQTTHNYKMIIRGTSEGEKQAQILIFGSPCEEELAVVIGADFQASGSVGSDDPSMQARIFYLDRHLRFEHHEIGELPYRILDITGRMVMSGNVGTGALVNVGSLVSGTYFAILEIQGKPISLKFIRV